MTTNLPGYHLSETLYQGTRTLVHRATRTRDSQPVIIKFLRNEYPSFSELVQFRNQYTIAKNLDLPGIVQPLSLETHGNGYALVMPDDGYVSLGKWQKEQFSLSDFLTIAIQLAEILHGLYQNRVIHKDIKPANILIHPETKQVKLIDFSISSLLPKETLQISNPNVLEGTLAYISPEQTGRMNRGIDYRTDFYSLGVTFYELLTGKLPFQSEDPMELVHCHIAKSPMALGNGEWGTGNGEEIPSVISDLLLKLMAKNAEDRYQSALGLKYDLEKCLYQWKEAGEIEPFELGERDICDRFTIPEKLYGREGEVQTLLDAFERVAQGASEMMLVAGFSGIGKTAVVNEVHKPIVRQRGYFIKGKFDQFNRNIPFSAFVSAFRDLMGQLLSESDEELANWKAKILEAVGLNGQVLIDVIPELERVIGSQPPATELSGTAAQNRFNLLFQKFIAVFTTPEHPLVMFLDDLQWADSASLNLMNVLMGESETGYLLLLGAYRDNEVFPAHPLMLSLGELEKHKATVSSITLASLPILNINQLIAETLSCTSKLAQPLTELVYQKTKGNPFFTTQFLKGLQVDELIIFNGDLGYWECDLVRVRDAALTDDVVEFMATQLQKLSEVTQAVLKFAACIGNQFDLETLAIVCESPVEAVAADLWSALREGLVIPITQAYKFFQVGEKEEKYSDDVSVGYRFLHDRVQQAAYSLIPEDQKQASHLQIGQLLQQNLSEMEKEQNLFEIVGHLNLGRELITQAKEREALARLNLAAGQKACNSTAYVAARSFVRTGLELLTANCWQTQYELTLNLYVAAAETAYLNGNFESMEALAVRVLKEAQTILDKVKIYEIQISALTTQSQMLEALVLGQEALGLLGIEFSSEPDEVLTQKALQTLTEQLQGKQIEELIDLPVMSDPQTIAAMQLLAMLFAPIFLAKPVLLPLHCSIMVSLSLKFGNASASTIGYAGYGMVLSAFLGEVERGYCFGRAALNLLDLFKVQEYKSLTLLLFGAFLQHRREALGTKISSTAKEGYLAGMETGNFLYAGYNMSNYFHHNFFAGASFDDWEPEIDKYCVVLAGMKQDSALIYLKIQQQMVDNLRKSVNEPDLLSGTAYDETLMLPKHHQDNELTAIARIYIDKLMLAYLFGNYTNARDYTAQANLHLMAVVGTIHIPIFYFYAGLTDLARCSNQSEIELENTLTSVETHQTTLAQWANYAPMNHQHKVDLVEAEKCRVLGEKVEAIELYDRAIAGAKANEYLQEEALANELAAKFYLNWGKEKIAQTYMVEAYYCYARWGAGAKTDHLEATYPQLLTPILQQPQSSLTLNSTTTLTSEQSVRTSTSTTTSLLDISAAIKASQALSEEIELEALLSQLMQIAIENAGADKGALILNNAETWEVVAQCIEETCKLSATPLDNARTLPASIVRAVQRTQKTVILDRADKDTRFASDTYLGQQQPKSLFCTPILNQSRLIGILYLENNLSAGAFTPERVEVLNLVCSQAAISIENARLYEQSQNYAKQLEGTVQELQQTQQQLQKSFEDLKQAQLQMVQSEKMSALGNLVAGVAHEINNPVGFIGGNLQPAQDYVDDLLGLIDLYQEENPHPSEAIEDEIEAIDLDFLRSDLPKLIDSMKLGVDRIAHISNSLRTFSRTDKEHKVPFNLHDGIDSTLLILKHRLKANEQRPAIEIVKEYGNIPEVQCFPGQLNQVFMNLIANAIDALDEGNADRRFEEIAANPNQITIQTHIQEEGVTIRISDNGVGMPEEVQKRIFEQGFTTKGVGKGTGLGMAIARQIIEEKHGGTISCTSEPGKGTEFAVCLR